jgi:hypothetical protein
MTRTGAPIKRIIAEPMPEPEAVPVTEPIPEVIPQPERVPA